MGREPYDRAASGSPASTLDVGSGPVTAPPTRLPLGPPAWRFHLVLALPALVLLWSCSSPAGISLLVLFGAALALLAAAAVWGTWLLLWSVARWRGRSTGIWRWFAVAPVCGIALCAVLALDLPLRARWVTALPALDAIVDDAPPAGPGDVVAVDAPEWVGTYRVSHADRVGDDVFVYLERIPVVSGGPFLVDAGFAHLPDGPPLGLYPGGHDADGAHYRHVGGDWYVWQTTW